MKILEEKKFFQFVCFKRFQISSNIKLDILLLPSGKKKLKKKTKKKYNLGGGGGVREEFLQEEY